MVVGTLELDLRLDGCRSLKDKRHIVKPLLERLRREYRVSAAEVGDHDLWGNACIGIAIVADAVPHAESVLQHVLDFVDGAPQIVVWSAVKQVHRP